MRMVMSVGLVRVAMPVLVAERMSNPFSYLRDPLPDFSRRHFEIGRPRRRSDDNSTKV